MGLLGELRGRLVNARTAVLDEVVWLPCNTAMKESQHEKERESLEDRMEGNL